MAVELRGLDISFVAEEDLSSYQYHFVVLSSTEDYVRLPDATAEVSIGILQNAPESGEAAAVRVSGFSKANAAEALTINDFVKPEYVSATDAGKATTITTGDTLEDGLRALVVKGVSAEDYLAMVMLY